MSLHSVMQSAFYHWVRRNIGMLLVLAALISAITTYVVLTGNVAFKPQRVVPLMVINITLLLMLITVVGTRVYRLWINLRTGSAGSKLQKRILVLFSIVAISPTIAVSIFSALFFNLGIQTWFNERVQTAVQESLAVAEAYLAEHQENIRGDALAMARDLNQAANLALSNPQEFNQMVNTQLRLRLLTEAIVFQGNHVIAQGALSFALAFERIPQDILERAARGEVVIMTSENDKVRALVRLEALPDSYLLVGRLVDGRVLDHMQSTQGAVHEYAALKEQLQHLQITFSVVFLTLAALLLLTCIWYGMLFAARLTGPISSLVLAAERVRGGDFSARVDDQSQKDEIGTLSRAFNRMTEQLDAQRGDLIDANRRLDERRRFSEAVLSGVSAGVIALDRDKKITLFNRSAGAILSKVDQSVSTEHTILEVLPGIQELLVQAEHLAGEQAQSNITLDKNGKTVTLHVRVTVEQLGSEIEGFIVTFDDITLLTAAQRNAAWADVARRVAHEIKNPLTPIQLSAERLKRKYLPMITEEQENFVKYTDTITKHVADIGRMVEEFVSFARMPAPRFADEDMVSMIRKAVFSAQVPNPAIEFKTQLPSGTVKMHCDERQMTQVLSNLLKNACEAIEARMEKQGDGAAKGVIAVTLDCKDDRLDLVIEDNGTGFPPADMQKMLDPYVTTRSKGTGLGLSIVKKIVEDHKGNITLENISTGGARVVLSFLQHCDINAAA